MIGRPSASSRIPGSLVAACAGSKPLTIGLMASTEWPSCRKCRIRPAATKVLPTSVPVAVMKIALTVSAQDAPAHDSREPLDLGVGVLRRECKPQPRGARRHRRRPDRDHQEALLLEQGGGRERRLGLAEDDRHDGALRLRQSGAPGERLGLGERARGVGRLALDQVDAPRWRPRRPRAAGRSNR